MTNKEFPPVCSVEGVRARLLSYSLTPNKALGQNFLVDTDALARMVNAASIAGRPVMEIGAGLGALTEALLIAGASKVAAIEKDHAMAVVLQESIDDPRLTVYHEDALHADFAAIHKALGGGTLTVAGNLPYYITTPIVLRLLDCGLPIGEMLLMLQQEAADRFFAEPGSRQYGPLTVLCHHGYDAKRLFTLSPASYYPQPAVHSAVVLLTSRATPPPAGFLAFLQGAFAMRRKTLLNNLLAFGHPRTEILAVFQRVGIESGARAEALTPATLTALFHALAAK